MQEQLQDILASMVMSDEKNTLDQIKNYAQTFGGLVGAEYAFFEDKELNNGNYFVESKELALQDLTFQKIDKTPLGKQIKQQIQRLEYRVKGYQTNLVDIKNQWKSKEKVLLAKAEEQLKDQFEYRLAKTVEKFKSEVTSLKVQHREVMQSHLILERATKKFENIIWAGESLI